MKNKWCLFVVFYVSFHACLCAETLRLVNLVYRHGDRSPIEIFPKDVNQIEKWPQGLGWLSKLLKTRYIDTGFMKEEYRRYEISIESSDEDRCLMSAYSNLAGMYPPDDDQKFNHDIPWQPIPVHTRPAYEDNMFYQYLGNVSGWDHENISNIWRIADTLYCEKSHNLTVNTWADQKWNNTQTVFEKLRKLENFQFTLLYNGSEMSMLKGGCAFDCPFDQFVKLTKGAVPTDWKRQCGYPEPKGKSGSSGLSTGWIVSIGLTGLLVVVLVVGITCVVKEQRKHANMPYGRFDVSS
ncbi:PPAL-like protein [Mya arenaria]|uniref:acid phosphatase n=1 Tax=Mya arenaria TaxID=6604 RepID=A0ABY7D975_MYAAR|nr:PPAL-like protein [Mya arenaria]